VPCVSDFTITSEHRPTTRSPRTAQSAHGDEGRECGYTGAMAWLEHFNALARYNQLMNAKLYRCAGTLDDAERKRDRGAFFGSIYGTFNHLLLADRIWMLRFTGDAGRYVSRDSTGSTIQVQSLGQELYSDFATLSTERSRTDADILAYTQALEAEALDRTFEYRTMAGTTQSNVLWGALGHFFNHQTHHRGQITTLLTQAGVDPGATDLVAMLRDEARFAVA
jgi:uncharacterized damage-inducible protein DinB